MSDQVTPPLHPSIGNELKWPKILGILSIVYGAISILGSAFSAFTGSFLRFQMKMDPNQSENAAAAVDQFVDKWQWYFLTGGVAGLVMSGALIWGGIALLRHKKIARPLFFAYSIIAILFSVFGVYITVAGGMIDEQMSAMFGVAPGEDLDAIPGAKIGRISGIAGGIAGAVFGLIPPVFFLIWFLRNQIKADIVSRFS